MVKNLQNTLKQCQFFFALTKYIQTKCEKKNLLIMKIKKIIQFKMFYDGHLVY